MRLHRVRALVVGVAVGAVATWGPWGTLSHTAGAAASACSNEPSPVVGKFADVNHDGLSDLLVGVPGATVNGIRNAGAVDVRLGKQGRAPFDGRDVLIHLADPHEGDHFGAAIAMGDLDGDCDVDAVVGIPGLDEPGAVNAGGIVLLRHTADFQATDLQPMERETILDLPRADERFGSALDLRSETLGKPQGVVIGAPEATVGDAANAGRVVEFTIDATTGQPDPSTVKTYDQSQSDVPGEAKPAARFGASIRAGNRPLLMVGAPGYSIHGKLGAGAVVFLNVPSGGSQGTSCLRSEDSPHVPGTADPGDHLGAALGQIGFAGAPGEEVDGARNAGAVYVYGAFCGLEQPGDHGAYRETQNSRTISDHAETGDHFGAVLGTNGFIGVPGEDVGHHRNAGIVQSSYRGSWRPGVLGFPGRPTTNARFGASLLTAPTNEFRWAPDGDGIYLERQSAVPVIAAPGADHGRGIVYVSRKYVLRQPRDTAMPAAAFGASAASSAAGQ